jgi:putative heme-binding domain-containing protein
MHTAPPSCPHPFPNIRATGGQTSRLTTAILAAFSMARALCADPVDSPTRQPDAYNNWKLALSAGNATDPATITVPPGFKVELLRSSQPGEDSWVSMAFDPQGRLTVACEKQGLLRFTLEPGGVKKVERINDSLLECRGLLYTNGALYADANNSKSFVRLRSTKNDDQFEEITELLHTDGGVGHGRNHVKLGPDGQLYLVHGNNVVGTPHASSNSPVRPMQEDRLIPCPWDPQMFDGDVTMPAGHILHTDLDGRSWTMFAGGFRNELDVAFNEDGEMFTFDADMEWDAGAPWYRPTRINHVISGADYGWRRGTSKWPDYFPDCGPTLLNIGLSSPTGVIFGTKSNFPGKYKRMCYICDWAYGRIMAVQLCPKGASYTAKVEPFVNGRPLNVTDAAIGQDGAMYFITGGRKTQSGLYRVSYTGSPIEEPAKTAEELEAEKAAAEARALRHRLEAFHGHPQPGAVEKIWPHLASSDPWIRHAARIALEWQDVASWRDKALAEPDITGSLTALLALARSNDTPSQRAMLARLDALPFAALTDDQQILALRDYQLAFIRLGAPDATMAAAAAGRLDALYPARAWEANHLLCELLVYLKSPHVIEKTTALLTSAERSEDLLHYLFFLRYVTTGWTPEERSSYFKGLNRAVKMEGARSYQSSLRLIRSEVVATLTRAEREALGSLLDEPAKDNAVPNTGPQVFVKVWTAADLVPKLDRISHGRSFSSGRQAFAAAQCVACHRMGKSGGDFGPDLTAVAARFSRHDILDSILEPSKVIDEKYRNTLFTLRDGSSVAGTIDREEDAKVFVRTSPLSGQTTALNKSDIVHREQSPVSPMPPGLLNVLTENQILDLLAYLESGGDPQHADFKP